MKLKFILILIVILGVGATIRAEENADLKNNRDFLEWQTAMGQDKVELIYSGPYNGNPASLFGHLFLKFTNKNNLLSYTVAFMANTEDDPDVLTIWKGLTGGYTASFSINPYYINTALYNNSESRDLWEFPLLLSQSEISHLQKRIWEIQKSKPESYLFFTRNCAYKILELFDELKPELKLKKQANLLIIPLDVVKILAANGLINEQSIHQRKSIRKHLNENLQQFSSEQNRQYRQAKANVQMLDVISDTLVLDTLIDRWKYQNYKKKLKLSQSELQNFEKTLSQRSQIKDSLLASNENILQSREAISDDPPHLSHKTSWLRGGLGTISSSQDNLKIIPDISFRLGVHALTSSSLGLAGHSYMEYLGFDFGTQTKILPFSIYNLDDFYLSEPLVSWKLTSALKNSQKNSMRFFNDELMGQIESGIGISDRQLFILVGPALYKNGKNALQVWMLLPHLDLGLRYENSDYVFLLQFKKNFISTEYRKTLSLIEVHKDVSLAFVENSLQLSITGKLTSQSEWLSQLQIEDRAVLFTMGLRQYY